MTQTRKCPHLVLLLAVCNPVKTMVLVKTSVDFKTYHRMFVVEIWKIVKKLLQVYWDEKIVQDSKKSCFSSTMDVLPGGNKKLQFIEEKIDLVDETIPQFKILSGNAMKCIVPFVKELVSNQPKRRTRKEKTDHRKSRERKVRRGDRNPWKRTLEIC